MCTVVKVPPVVVVTLDEGIRALHPPAGDYPVPLQQPPECRHLRRGDQRMLKNIAIFLATFFVALSVFVWAENAIAPKFQACISQYTSEYSAKSSYDKGDSIAVIRGQVICSLSLVDRHNGFGRSLGHRTRDDRCRAEQQDDGDYDIAHWRVTRSGC